MLTTTVGENHHRRSPPATSSEVGTTMERVPERSRTTTRSLHNFTSLPCFNVTWGRRKQLRCVKDSDHYYYLRSSYSPPPVRRRSSTDYDGDGIESVRERLMLDLRIQVDQMKDSIFKINHRNGENRPWNLRTRRAVCKNPNFNGGGGADRKVSFPAEIKSPSRKGYRGGKVEEVDGAKPRARAKFSVSLSKQEIDEDFVSILGNRPSRRPKKRPKYVQNQIDVVFPGYWLSEVTSDMYKVNKIDDLAPKGC